MKKALARLVRVSPAMVVAMLALMVALGGAATAADKISKPEAKAAKTAKTAPPVKRGPRGKRGLRGLRGVPGPRGAQGPAGAQGPQGPAGASNPNADTLNGYAANGIARVARANAGQTVLPAADAVLATVNITAPSAGFVFLQADYNIAGTGCPCEAWMVLKDVVSSALSSNYKITEKAVDGGYTSGSSGWVFPVNAGARSFQLLGKNGQGTTVTVDAPALQAIFVPFGSTGAGTLGTASVAAASPTATQ